MTEGRRTIHIVTGDEVVLNTARAAVGPLDAWDLAEPESIEALLSAVGTDEVYDTPVIPGYVILLDGSLGASASVYENCRRLAGHTRCRTFVVVPRDRADVARPIATFCGATGVLEKPLSAEALRTALEATGPPPAPPEKCRGAAPAARPAAVDELLPERLLRDLTGEPTDGLVSALIYPETSLFNYEFLVYKLDEEYKRARRFGYSLSCVMLGFEGQADEAVLQRLSSIFLSASRDTDVLGRFDESSFLFLLPHTGPDGAQIMARRIGTIAEEEGLVDLVGDRLSLSVGISTFPHQDIQQREDLYHRARNAFLEAQRAGGGLVTTA